MYLEQHLHSKDAGEDVVKVLKNNISFTFLINRIFCSQSYGASDNNDHDKGVKKWICDNLVYGNTEPEDNVLKKGNYLDDLPISGGENEH